MNSDTVNGHEMARIVDAEVNEDELTVHLEDGRSVTTPVEWYPRLVFATSEERQYYEITGRGGGLHWPMLDEDLSVRGMLSGTPSVEGVQSLKGGRHKRDVGRVLTISLPFPNTVISFDFLQVRRTDPKQRNVLESAVQRQRSPILRNKNRSP